MSERNKEVLDILIEAYGVNEVSLLIKTNSHFSCTVSFRMALLR